VPAAARRAAELVAVLDRLRAERDARATELGDEEHDVARLEGMSLGRVLSALRGSREEQLARERAEAEVARYRLAEAQSLLDAAQAEHDAAHLLAGDLPEARAALDRALRDKERRLKDSADPRAPRLLEIAAGIGALRADVAETREAFEAAGAALQALDRVLDRLHSASGWSTYDTFFGGGLVSSAIKHSHLDDAAHAAQQADRALLVLRRELADVGQVSPVGFTPVEGLTRFADLWLDNIFTDLAVRQRITRSLDDTVHTRRQVDALQQALLRRRDDLLAREAALAAERDALLTGG
jgi:hypothetical protein